jgi:hypothetical protein
MAAKQTRSNDDRLTHPLLEKLGAIPAQQAEIFAYSVKIVCGKQTETSCCCVAGTRPGVYATEVNIQNLNLVPAAVGRRCCRAGAQRRRPRYASCTRDRPRQTSAVGGDDGRLLPHRGVAAGRAPERRHRAYHRHPDARERGRAVRFCRLHGDLSERRWHQHRRRVHSVATIGVSWLR